MSMFNLQRHWEFLSCLLLSTKWTIPLLTGQRRGACRIYCIAILYYVLSLCNYELCTYMLYDISSVICRFDEIESKMVPFLKSSGYNVKKGKEFFLPIEIFRNALFLKLFDDLGKTFMVRCTCFTYSNGLNDSIRGKRSLNVFQC